LAIAMFHLRWIDCLVQAALRRLLPALWFIRLALKNLIIINGCDVGHIFICRRMYVWSRQFRPFCPSDFDPG
jgi:hypothetical protein